MQGGLEESVAGGRSGAEPDLQPWGSLNSSPGSSTSVDPQD
jgi:hypothetical protein